MNSRKRIAVLAVAATITVFSGSQSVFANDLTDLFKRMVTQTVSGADPIAQRESVLSSRIIDAINANRLSTSQTQALKAQFDHVKDLEASYRATSGLDGIETASLNAELSKVESMLDVMLAGGSVSHAPGGFITHIPDNTGIVPPSVFENRLRDLGLKISTNLASGRLTLEEAKALQLVYDNDIQKLNALKGDGRLGREDQMRMHEWTEDLDARIQSNLHDAQQWPGIDGQQALQAQRIQDGLAHGAISQREFAQLKAEVDRVGVEEAAARAHGLELNETIRLAYDMRDLDRRINISLKMGGSAQSDVNRKEEALTHRINLAVLSRKISSDDAYSLRQRIEWVNNLERSYRANGRGLDPMETQRLVAEIDQISARLDRMLTPDVRQVGEHGHGRWGH